MPYEYEFLTQIIRVGWDASAAQHAFELEQLGREWFPQIEQHLATMDGGGWEIVSHAPLLLGNAVVMTLLVRRESTGRARLTNPS